MISDEEARSESREVSGISRLTVCSSVLLNGRKRLIAVFRVKFEVRPKQ